MITDTQLLEHAVEFQFPGELKNTVVRILKAPRDYVEGNWYIRRVNRAGYSELLHNKDGWLEYRKITDGGFLFKTARGAIEFYLKTKGRI